MEQLLEIYVGIGVAKARNAVAVADGEANGRVRSTVEMDASNHSMRGLVD